MPPVPKSAASCHSPQTHFYNTIKLPRELIEHTQVHYVLVALHYDADLRGHNEPEYARLVLVVVRWYCRNVYIASLCPLGKLASRRHGATDLQTASSSCSILSCIWATRNCAARSTDCRVIRLYEVLKSIIRRWRSGVVEMWHTIDFVERRRPFPLLPSRARRVLRLHRGSTTASLTSSFEMESSTSSCTPLKRF